MPNDAAPHRLPAAGWLHRTPTHPSDCPGCVTYEPGEAPDDPPFSADGATTCEPCGGTGNEGHCRGCAGYGVLPART
jgi:hypothetical protein